MPAVSASRTAITIAIVFLFGSCGPRANSAQSGANLQVGPNKRAKQHIIVVSVDGLPPQSYTEPDTYGLRVPTLRSLVREGAYSKGALSVFPSMTYPAHTSMVTGVQPNVHGIVRNKTFDPLARNRGGMFWYAEDIAVPTIWQLARAAGLRTALVIWPVTVGAHVDHLVAEYWRASTADDVKLNKALSTRGLLDATAARFPDFWDHYTPREVADKAPIDVAIHLLETTPPALMLVHLLMVDEYTHRHGPWSAESKQRIEEADMQIGRLIDAAKRVGIWDKTTLVVISDHGFLPIHHRIRPGVVLAKRGLVTVGPTGSLTDWKAVVAYQGGMAYLYVKNASDDVTKKAVLDAFNKLVGKPDSGIERILSNADIVARGGDPDAFIALEASPGYAFKDKYTGDYMFPAKNKGHHGFDPQLEGMKASLLIHGPNIRPGLIQNARLIDVAPTLAAWLGLDMPTAAGRDLDVRTGQ